MTLHKHQPPRKDVHHSGNSVAPYSMLWERERLHPLHAWEVAVGMVLIVALEEMVVEEARAATLSLR